MTASEAEADRRALYRASGMAAVVLAGSYVVITGLYVVGLRLLRLA
jgi:hypothetical protein